MLYAMFTQSHGYLMHDHLRRSLKMFPLRARQSLQIIKIFSNICGLCNFSIINYQSSIMKSSETFEELRKALGTFGNLQGPSGTSGDLREPSKTFGNLEKPTKTFEDLRKPPETFEKLRKPLKTFGSLQKTLKRPFECHQKAIKKACTRNLARRVKGVCKACKRHFKELFKRPFSNTVRQPLNSIQDALFGKS